jgi:hypothetical protein
MARALGQHHQPLGPDRSGLVQPPHRAHTDNAVPGSELLTAGYFLWLLQRVNLGRDRSRPQRGPATG